MAWVLIAFLALGDEPGAPTEAPRPAPPGAKDPQAPAAKKAPAVKAVKTAPAKAPPRRVVLPEAGECPAAELLELAGKLFGRPVAPDGARVEETPVTILKEMAGQRVGRDEIKILLAAHRVYLFPHEGVSGPVLVATRDPGWTPEKSVPLIRRRFQIRSKDFDRIAGEVERHLEEVNRKAPAGQPRSGAAIDPRTRLIIVRVPSERVLAGVEEIIGRLDRPDPGETHIYTYSPKHRKASELRELVLGALTEPQAKRVTLVVSSRGTLLLIRASDDHYRKVLMHLESFDN